MKYKISARGLITFKETADKMAGILYPEISKALKQYKSEIQQLYKNYNFLNQIYSSLSESQQKRELDKYLTFKKSIQDQIENDLTQSFNSARFMIKNPDLDNDFDILIELAPNNDWKAHYHNKTLRLSILDIESKEDLAETLEHELVHNKQFKHMPNDFSDKAKKKMRNTNYLDLKVEGPALATNILRELPNLDQWVNEEYVINKTKHPWLDYNDFVIKTLSDLTSNSYLFQNYLNLSEWYRITMQGDEDRDPMQKRYRRNKLNKILHEAISNQAKEILARI